MDSEEFFIRLWSYLKGVSFNIFTKQGNGLAIYRLKKLVKPHRVGGQGSAVVSVRYLQKKLLLDEDVQSFWVSDSWNPKFKRLKWPLFWLGNGLVLEGWSPQHRGRSPHRFQVGTAPPGCPSQGASFLSFSVRDLLHFLWGPSWLFMSRGLFGVKPCQRHRKTERKVLKSDVVRQILCKSANRDFVWLEVVVFFLQRVCKFSFSHH